MRKAIIRTLAAAAALVWASGAAAAPILFSGEGVIARSIGNLPATGAAEAGDPFRFSFVFDPDDATQLFIGAGFAAYTLPFTSFSATLGDYAFTPTGSTAQVNVGRGFTFFGGTSTEPSRSFSFSFRGTPGPGAPFTGAVTEQLSISASFRDSAAQTDPVTLADVTDPATAGRRSFDYVAVANPGPPPSFSVLSGSYDGSFATVAGGVPEPTTWAMMIVGFGAVGGVMRRRERRALAA